ncbi:MAG: Ig-like domain-containing protein, partial [Treponema sp.]|nr:Ig-like domain-containing protein [Treponema sp.]
MKHLKKIGYVFGAVFILCALIFASCVGPGPDNPLAVTGVTLSASTLILNVGASGQLTATVQPSDAQNKNVTWSSSNTSVATVQSGLVTAVGTGTAIITVVTDDGAYKAMCTVTVPAAGTAVTGVLLSSSLSLKVGASGQLTATVQPSTAANKNVTWSSSNNNIATVSNGLVTGESVGTATIIVTTVEGGFTANCTVTVTPSGNEHVAVTDVSLNLPTFSMDVGEDRPLTPEVLPVNATNKAVSWSSSNTSVVTVSNGLVIGVGVGTAIITVTTVDGGFEDTTVFTITEPDINHPVTGVTLDEDEIDLYEGDSTILTANVTPDNATEKGKTWSSSNEDVATIDANGNVSAHSAGSTIITVTTDEGDFTDTCTVTVLKKIVDVPVSSVSLSPSTLTLNVGGKGELTANVLPVNATNKARIWTSSNEDVAIVDVNGIVTALSVGEATITVIMIENLNITAESTVEVTSAVIPDVAVSGVTLDEDEIELYEGDATILTANVTPDNATDKGKTWSSSDDDVA